MKTAILTMIALTILLAMGGCESRDERLARLAADNAAQQARQSEWVAQASANLTGGAQHLVESTGRAHESLASLQQELQAQHTELNRQRDLLEQEREALAWERRTSPVIANVLLQLGVLMICLLPLLLCWRVLHGPAATDTDQAIAEVLIHDLATTDPRLLTRQPPATASDPAGHLPPAS